MTAYCAPEDLLVGDMPTNPTRAQQFIDAAADEIAVALSPVYVWPPDEPLDAQTNLVLKRLNVLLATGRYVMAQAVGSEDTSVNAYGSYLLKEAHELLEGVMNQAILLPGVTKATAYATTAGNGPRVINEDSVSAMKAFYDFTNPWHLVGYQWGPNQ